MEHQNLVTITKYQAISLGGGESATIIELLLPSCEQLPTTTLHCRPYAIICVFLLL